MSLIKLQGNASGTGALTIAAPNTDTDRTLTLPDTTGTIVMNEGSGIFKIDSSGNVGIGVDAPNSGLHLKQTNAGGDVAARVQNSSTTAGSTATLYFTTTTTDTFNSAFVGSDRNNALILGSNTAEAARIDASGNLLVGTSVANGNISISNGGNATYSLYSIAHPSNGYNIATRGTTTTGAAVRIINSSSAEVGRIAYTASATSYVTSSDYRLKENVAPMQNALDTVAQLNPVTYTWKADGSAGQGFIAHELQAVVPDCVTGEKDAVDAEGNPQYQGVDTSFLVATLVKAIQELTARVAQLEAN